MTRWFWVPMLLWACETMPSSGEVWAPAVSTQAEEGAAEVALDVATEDDRVPGEPDPEQEEPAAAPPGALDAHLLEITGTADEEALSEEVELVPELSVQDEPSPSQGGVVSAAWGPRVLTTLSSLEPPRAVLALPDGSERVVRPGTLIPEIGAVVLAIGRDVVELSEVREQGVYASVHTRTIPALIPESNQP